MPLTMSGLVSRTRGGASSAVGWWLASSSAPCLPVSRTNSTESANAVTAMTAPATTRTSRATNSAASQPLTAAATATPPYPADSLSPSASPRRLGPTRSIFMTTVIDQARPWLTPRKTLAVTTQPQLGATAINSGTGSASAQPSSSSRRRPTRSASAPAPRFVNDLASPKATMNERTAALEPTPKSSLPIRGSVERSSPTIAPTNTLTATSRPNWAAFSRSPSRTEAEPLMAPLSPLALLDVDEQRGADDVGGDPGHHDAPGERIHGYRRTTLPETFAATISA